MDATESQRPQGEADDAAIIAQVRAGEINAFGALVRRHSQRLYRIAVSVLRNDADAEEVVQETFVRAYTHLGQFQGRAQFSTWLARIAFHEALARQHDRRRFVDVEVDGDGAQTPLFHHGMSPDRSLANRELSTALQRSLANLPELYRESFALVYIEELSRSAAAAALKITRSNLKVRLHRARRLLRAQMSGGMVTTRPTA